MRRIPVLSIAGLLAVCATASAHDEAVERGKKVYATQKCSLCHSVEGKGNKQGALDDIGSKLSADEIRQWLLEPKEMTEKTKSTRKPVMPSYSKLPKEDLDALVAYLQTLKKKA